MFYNFYRRAGDIDYNECAGRGMCSIAPSISSFQEVMLILLRNITYYVIKLEELGKNCSDEKVSVAVSVSNLVSTTVYSDEQLLNIIICHYKDLIKLKRNYNDLCDANKVERKELKLVIKLTPEMSLSDILSIGQRAILSKYKKISPKQKCLSELLFISVKSAALSIVKLLDYGITDDEALNTLINSINIFNSSHFSAAKMKAAIKDLAMTDMRLWHIRKNTQEETFGKVSLTEVSHSTEPGKAILVSGSSLTDMHNLLEAVKEKDIDVYSHGDLLIAHAFDKFKEYKNFKGHFGSSSDNSVLDFATFPGAILLTKHATQNIEYLIRGRLFTTDNIVPRSVIGVKDNDFTELIKASEDAKGFSGGQKRAPEVIGFNFQEINEKFDEIAQNLNNGKIRHLFMIGMSNYSTEQANYFETLLKLIPRDCYVISFSYHCECDNLLYINVANNHPLLLQLLDSLFRKISPTADNLTYFLTKCDANTISSMINFKEAGAKSVYLSSCPPTVINPKIMESLMELYCIDETTNPKNDLEKILKQ